MTNNNPSDTNARDGQGYFNQQSHYGTKTTTTTTTAAATTD